MIAATNDDCNKILCCLIVGCLVIVWLCVLCVISWCMCVVCVISLFD